MKRIEENEGTLKCFFKENEGGYAQVFVRRLHEKVVDRLKKQTQDYGRSLESEVRTILKEAVPDYEGVWKQIEHFHKRLKKSGRTFSDSAELIREDRDREGLCD